MAKSHSQQDIFQMNVLPKHLAVSFRVPFECVLECGVSAFRDTYEDLMKDLKKFKI